ncbi:MAG: aconitate hydratase AcnA [Polyangiaceae bacterium]|nr:aconitate hydratase AcnA [Polyangiaceae bacterium]
MARSFGAEATLKVGTKEYTVFRLDALHKQYPSSKNLPYALKILLENLLRTENGLSVSKEDIEVLAAWNPKKPVEREISFTPSRVLLQDFTGVPAVVDLASMRDAMRKLGGEPKKINPLQAVELVIDHSVQVDTFGTKDSLFKNSELEFSRNEERYQFLRWGQTAFNNFRVVPPDTGIVHQVNVEYLARVVFSTDGATTGGKAMAYPDTLVGTDSHTTMVNGLGVLGWGVGGIEAEAAMLGQPVAMLIPDVIGFRLFGKLHPGATATDLVLTITQILRKKGVVGKFVEFFGEGLSSLKLSDRATIANMAPEYGATCGIFPIDQETLNFLRLTNRPEELVQLVESYAKEQGIFHTKDTPVAEYTDTLELDLGTVEPSLAGPARPQDRVSLPGVKESFLKAFMDFESKQPKTNKPAPARQTMKIGGGSVEVSHGSVVIAAITSCTNTSNPSVLMAAGLLAKKALEKGLMVKPWVKTSLAPGSKVVTDYLTEAGLLSSMEQLRFNVVGYGCTTCIGNSGPLPENVSKSIEDNGLMVAAVLSGNRNFEGRVHAEVRANYLASPPLVVAFALAGRVDIDLTQEPIGYDADRKPVFLKDIWPTPEEVQSYVDRFVTATQFEASYADLFKGDKNWQGIKVSSNDRYEWDAKSTYVKHPPYFEGMEKTPAPITDIVGARALAVLGDSITTDHISPAGNIKKDSPAGRYLLENGVAQKDFNQYGARRGNHEVMVRGTFANVRLRNALVPGTEGGITKHMPSNEVMSIFDAAMLYIKDRVPTLILAGKEYGSGSSRDWAAKGPKLLGIKTVIAESYERIHRSNLIGMGILPLQFAPGESAASLGLTGEETFDVVDVKGALSGTFAAGRRVKVKVKNKAGERTIETVLRIDTPQEVQYYEHGGILLYVLRQLLAN